MRKDNNKTVNSQYEISSQHGKVSFHQDWPCKSYLLIANGVLLDFISGLIPGFPTKVSNCSCIALCMTCHPGGHNWDYYSGALSIFKLLQFIGRSGTRRWNLRVPDLQMSCRDLTIGQGTRIVAPTMAVRWYAWFYQFICSWLFMSIAPSLSKDILQFCLTLNAQETKLNGDNFKDILRCILLKEMYFI